MGSMTRIISFLMAWLLMFPFGVFADRKHSDVENIGNRKINGRIAGLFPKSVPDIHRPSKATTGLTDDIKVGKPKTDFEMTIQRLEVLNQRKERLKKDLADTIDEITNLTYLLHSGLIS